MTASSSLEKAPKAVANVDDQMQVTIHEVIDQRKAGREGEADALAKKQVSEQPTSPATAVLRAMAPNVFSGVGGGRPGGQDLKDPKDPKDRRT